MRKPLKLAILSLAFCGFTAASLAAQSRWVVTAPPDLDSRIKVELEHLAKEHHARAEFVLNEMGSKGPEIIPGALAIYLIEEPDVVKFSQRLENSVNHSMAIPPELASDALWLITTTFNTPVKGRFERRVQIYAATPAGFHYALLRLSQWLSLSRTTKGSPFWPPPKSYAFTGNQSWTTLDMIDFPSFPQRGIVEGFYGEPWSQKQRLEMMRFEGEHGMNVYYYAPKDDPYHRKLWREPYPPSRMKELSELVDAAHQNFVNFCFAISPGLSMTYSSPDDFQKLTDKLDSVSKLGVSCFALFLDDVPQQLENPQDLAKYKDLGAAHVDVINRLYAYLKSKSSENRLVVTPTTYTNAWGSRDYIRELGEGVNPDVPIVWTGTGVVDSQITAAQANEWGALLRRKPLIWDNFPVNDGIRWRPVLGPMRGRAPDLPGTVQGLFSNPMIQPEASKIPLQTVADYLWNAEKYDPAKSWRHALVEQYGPAAPRQLHTFLSTYGDYWWDENIFQPLFTERRTPFDTRAMKRRIVQLNREAAALGANRRYRALARELRPFPVKTNERLPKVLADPAFEHLTGGRLRWRKDYDDLQAAPVPASFKLDGDFSKWRSGKVYHLDARDQLSAGRGLWRGPEQFSIRFGLGWDANHLYIGVDVTDPDLYQPFRGRDVAKGDLVSIVLETAFKKNLLATHAAVDEYDLLASPGNFQGIAPDVYSSEDYLPPRPVAHDYPKEVQTAWQRTATGYSGDIALPAWWFEGGKFSNGYEVGLILGAQKVFPPPAGNISEEEQIKRMTFHSKADAVFPARFGNPATYQRLVLLGAAPSN